MTYLLIKSLHIFFVFIWISGMLLQTIVLSIDKKLAGPAFPQEITRLRLLYKWDQMVTTPAMVFAMGTGILMGAMTGFFGSGWLLAKICLVFLLAAFHGIHAGKLRRMVEMNVEAVVFNTKKAFAVLSVLIFAIIVLVIFKPF